jgi:sec-independent protein translocase protein TatA
MFRNIGAPEILILAVLLIVIFGWKRLPEAARSLGRSARVFKSEMQEMKNEGKQAETIKGETIKGEAPAGDSPVQESAPKTDTQPGSLS